MELQIKGRNLEVSESMRTFAERKLAKLGRLCHESTRVELELAIEKNPSVAAHEVAEATTIGVHGRHAAPLKRAGAHRTDARGQHS